MNKSNEYRGKNGKYFTDKEEENLAKFSKLVKYNNWKNVVTGGTETCEVYDAWMKIGDITYIIELKDRNVSHTSYKEYIIETDKYCDLLMRYIASGGKYTPVYINFFSDGYVLSFNLLDCTDARKGYKYNACNYGYGTNEDNVCYYLDAKKAKIYRYE